MHKEKEILAKKHKEIVTQLPKKEIVILINKTYDGDKFLLGNGSKAHSFIFPNNDFSASDDFVLIESKTVSHPLDYLYSDSFFYKNDLSIFKGCTSGFPVRPPPYLS